MTTEKLITIPVAELQPGMIIHQIGKQSGRLTVKHIGRVRHLDIIDRLIAGGVQTVVVEKPSEKFQKTIESFKQRRADFIKGSKRHAQRSSLSSKPIPSKGSRLPSLPVTSEGKLTAAKTLLDDLKKTFKSIKDHAKRGLNVELRVVDEAVESIVEMLENNRDALIFATMLPDKDEYLHSHSVHCAILLCHFAQHLKFSLSDCKRLATLGYLFDIGMSNVPKEITHSADNPSIEEQIILETHVQYSLEFVGGLAMDNELLLAIEQHHERLDGSGYPYGLEGDNIHLFARMLAIVDCFDAMTSDRPFQKSVTAASALKLICDPNYGYDQKLAVKFLRCIGIYPAGSMVALDDNHLAVVIKVSENEPLKPLVKTLFSLSSMDYCQPQIIDLNDSKASTKIIKPINPAHFGIDLRKAEY